MKLLSRSHPKCKSVVFMIYAGLFIGFFIFSYIGYYVDLLFRYPKKFSSSDFINIFGSITIGIIIGAIVFIYFFGEIRWRIKGEEAILYDMNYLYIVNKGRVFGKIKKYPWKTITGADVIELSIYEQIMVYISFTGEIDERIQITRYKKRKIYCGINLNEKECKEVIEALQKLINSDSRI